MYHKNGAEWRLADWPPYPVANRALWALAVILPIFYLLSIPSIRAVHQQAEADLANEIASENLRYCEKWGMPAGSPEHAFCVRDLIGIRARAEQRVRDEAAGEF
jgi:hypothetical protein